MAEKTVLQEFLAKLGFQVDKPSAAAFLQQLKTNCMTAGKLTATLGGVGIAAEAMATIYAHSMEKMYFSSQRVRASVSNMEALDYATRQIGLNAEDTKQSLENMAAKLRLNPATSGLMEMLGVSEQGKDRVELLLDLVQSLKQQFSGDSYFQGASFAEQLGISEPVFKQLSDHLEEARKFYADRKRLQQNAGVDSDAAARAAREYQVILRELWEKLGLLGDKLKIELLEPFKDINKELSDIISQFTTWLSSEEGRSSISSMAVHFIALSEVASETMKSLAALKSGNWAEFNKHDEQAFAAMQYMLGIGQPTGRIQAALEKQAKGKGNLDVSIPGDLADAAFAHRPGSTERGAIPYPNLDKAMGPGGSIPGWRMDNIDFLWNSLNKSRDPLARAAIQRELETQLVPSAEEMRGARLGAGGQTSGGVNMEVNITTSITAGRDAGAIADAVERSQRRVLGDAVRDLQGAVR